MKLLFDARVHLNYFSGISRYIICLLDAYLRLYEEDEVIVLLNKDIDKSNSIYQVLSKYENLSFQVLDKGHMGPKNYTSMGKVIKTLKPDVYHYPHLDAPIFTGDIPVVATIHDINSNDKIKKFEDRFGLKSLYFKKAIKSTLKRADKVLFVSDSVKNEVLDAFNYNKSDPKFVRIYNGLESNFNEIDPKREEEIIEKFDLETPYFLFVGQIREHKNIHRIVQAFRAYYNEIKTHRLIIVGHNYQNVEWEDESITHYDKVSNSELKTLYKHAELFLFPSLFEGFGFPIIEAMSFGTKVLTTNYGATKEVSGGLATLVDPNDIQSIKNGMEDAMNSLTDKLKLIAHADSFSWEAHAKQLRQIYLSVIK